jgi:hypothetical protein
MRIIYEDLNTENPDLKKARKELFEKIQAKVLQDYNLEFKQVGVFESNDLEAWRYELVSPVNLETKPQLMELTMSKLQIGDTVFNSPVGPGVLTGVTDAGFPQINHVAVARLIHKDKEGQFGIFDPYRSYSKGDYELFLDDERDLGPVLSTGTVLVRSSKDAINVVKSIGALPKKIYFDHDLGGDDTSINFIRVITEMVLDGKLKFRDDFSYEVHSQNPIGSKNICGSLNALLVFTKDQTK